MGTLQRDERAPRLSLVIPCFNERKNLPLLIARIAERFGGSSELEVVLVDNGSSDGSSPLFLEAAAQQRVIRSVRVEVNRGYGFGILAGLDAARGRYLGFCHADMQTDPADALVALRLIGESPHPERLYLKGRRYGRPLNDVLFTVGMSAFETALLRVPLWDINAQPNVFPRAFYEAVRGGAPHDFSLDLYLYHAAKSHGLEIVRFPVRFAERAHGVSHWNIDWRSKLKFIRRTVEFSLELQRRISERAKGT
jgi:glycosyltransferase involved in cell wall biosynthesis